MKRSTNMFWVGPFEYCSLNKGREKEIKSIFKQNLDIFFEINVQ